MASPFTFLTARGNALLFAGGTLIAVAAVIGERDLLRAGILVLLLPLLGAVLTVGVPYQIVHTRSLEPPRIPLGSQARVRLRVRNRGHRSGTGALRLADALPAALRTAPRFAMGRLGPGEEREVTYRLRPRSRGRFTIGPLTLRVVDPLGCVAVPRRLGGTASLLVTPAVVVLPPVALHGDSADQGASSAQVMSSAGEDDAAPREYRHGDDLRRVHWRSTARHGRLMVRHEEHQWLDHSTVLLDMRAVAHSPAGERSSLETAVSTAASIALRFLTDGHDVRLVTDTEEMGTRGSGDALLDALAVATTSPAGRLQRGISLLGRAGATGHGQLVAVTGAVDADEVEALSEVARGQRGRCLAVLVHGAAWPTPEALDTARDRLVRANWRVLVVSEVGELPERWTELAPQRSLTR